MPAESPSPESRSAPGRPAELLELGLAVQRPWRPEELAAVWEYHLSAPLQIELAALEPGQARALHDLSAAQGLLLSSLRGLLRHPVPPLELLVMVKDFAKGCLHGAEPRLPAEIAGLLYHLTIAVGLARLGERITALSDTEMLRGLDWALSRDWVDTGSRATLAEAARQLRSAQPGDDGTGHPQKPRTR